MRKFLLSSLFIPLLGTCARAQSEIRWTVNLNTDQIRQTDKRVFQSLEKDLVTFLNGQTWTDDRFTEEERIEATVFLTVSEVFEKSSKGDGAEVPVLDQYNGTLNIQSLRPVYRTAEKTPVLNIQDGNVPFSYRQGEGIQYSEQSYISDLGMVMAFYSYLVLGFDYDTFSPLGGDPFFNQAQELYNRLPVEIQNTAGWKTDVRAKNRYALMENVLNPRMLPMRRGYYTYHRLGLDQMASDVTAARSNITLAIEDVQKANQTYPSTQYAQVFVDAKRDEIVEIYKAATGIEQNTVISAMSRVDPSKASSYRAIRFRSAAGRTSRAGVRGRQ